MKFTGVVLLCCAILVTGQQVQDATVSSSSSEDTTTTPASTTTKATTTATPTTTSPSTTTPTTTTQAPAPAPVPTPPPPPPSVPYPRNVHKWTLEDSKNATCIVLKAALQVVIVEKNQTHTLDVPPTSVPSGSCENPETLTILWNSTALNENKTAYLMNELTFVFKANKTKTEGANGNDTTGITLGKYGVESIDVVVYLDNTTESRVKKDQMEIDVFQTPLNHSYTCLAEESLKNKNGDFTLKIREVQLEAYRADGTGHQEFSASVQCPADDATDVVPIAVGAALAGLVVIVLIAYLIGRKRSRARGYQSV